MVREKLQLYIHIPFCIRKCDYCDFLSFPASREVQKAYLEALISQIRQSEHGGKRVSSIFIGGGTPSLLEGEEMIRLMEEIRDVFFIMKDAEITLEANPGTLSEKKVVCFKKAGINRLSIGLQSADNKELQRLGRIHSFEQFLENYKSARNAGFSNINIDLMSALPGQNVESYRRTLEKVLALSPEHLSAYSLIIEEGTPFYQQYGEENKRREEGKTCHLLPSEEEERQMYYDTEKYLSEKGYQRYEISNYAKKGYECRHNIGYWKRENYLGMGLGAASLMGHERFCMTSDLKAYVSGDFGKKKVQLLSEAEEMEEFMFLGLRLRDGVRRSDFEKHFGIKYSMVYGQITETLVAQGLLENCGERIKLTDRGMDVSNYVMAQFLF